MDLLDLDLLMQQGEYDRAVQEISNLPAKDHLDGKIFKVHLLAKMGRFKEAFRLSEQILREKTTKKTPFQELSILINFGYCLFGMRNYQKMSEMLQKAEALYLELEKSNLGSLERYSGALYYLRGYLTFIQGTIPQALDLLQKSLEIRESLENKQEIAETAIAIGWVHLDETGDLILALKYIQRSLELSQQLGNKTDIAFSFHRLGNYYMEKGNYDKAYHYMQKSIDFYQIVNNEPEIARLYHNMGFIIYRNEDYEKSFEYIQRGLAIYEKLGDMEGKGACYNLLSWFHWAQGDVDLAIDYRKNGLKISETLGHGLGSSFHLMILGRFIQWGKGDLSLAREHLQKSLQMNQEFGSDRMIAINLIYLAQNHFLKGETSLALETIEESLKISTKIENNEYKAECLLYKGIIHKILGKFDLAEEYLTESHKLINQHFMGNKKILYYWDSQILYHLISIAYETSNLEKATLNLQLLQEMANQSNRKSVDLQYRFASALVKTMNKRAIDKFQAQQIFQEIVNDEIIDHNLTNLAMLYLCELLILELKISESEEKILKEVTALSDKLHNVTQSQSSSVLYTMSLILKSKLALVNGNLQEASEFLKDAKNVANENELVAILTQIENEQKVLHSEFEKWEDLYHRNASIKERIEQARVESYLLEAKKIQETWLNPSTDSIS